MMELQEPVLSRQMYVRALHHLDEAIAAHNLPLYRATRGTVLFGLGDYKGAGDCFEELLATTRDGALTAEIKNNYACMLAQRGDAQRAAALWQELAGDPTYLTPEVALLNYSCALIAQKRYDAARTQLFEAIAKDPNYLDAHYQLARLAWDHLGDHSLARKELTTALFLDPNHREAQAMMHAISSTGSLAVA